jgi:hypothetical protein
MRYANSYGLHWPQSTGMAEFGHRRVAAWSRLGCAHDDPNSSRARLEAVSGTRMNFSNGGHIKMEQIT